MNFVVLRSEGVMSIDNEAIELNTTGLLPAHVEILAWRGEKGSGFIERNDCQRVVEKVEDLIPYRLLVDSWIDAASRLPTPISLAQAHRIKLDMVEAVYKNKRIAPYPYGAYVYEATDEAVAYMSAAVSAFGLYNRVDELIGRVDAAFAQVVYLVNVNVDQNNISAAQVNSWSANMQSNWSALTMSSGYGGDDYTVNTDPMGASGVPATIHWHQAPAGHQSFSFSSSPDTGSGGVQPMSHFAPIDTSVGGGIVSMIRWNPISPPGIQWIDSIQFRDALRAIVARRRGLETIRAWHKQVIPTLLSIPAVIAHDVAGGGW